MRTPSSRTFDALILGLALLVSGPAFAGEAEWKAHMTAGAAANQRGDYPEAIRQLEAALKEAESFGEQDIRLASTLHNLADVYRPQNRNADAEALYKRSLVISELVLGQEHPSVAGSVNNLAGLYADQGRYRDAESLYKRSLAIREKALGPEHLDVAQSLNNLAVC